MSEHSLSITGYGKVHQEMVYQNGAFEVLSESVVRRRGATEVTCSCGETFDGTGRRKTVVKIAKDHLLNAEWEAENLPDGADPLRIGDRIEVDEEDQPDWEIVDLRGSEIEVHMDGGILPITDRQAVLAAIERTRNGGADVRVVDENGAEKAI